MWCNKNAQTDSSLSAYINVCGSRHPCGRDLFFSGNEANDWRIDVLGNGPIGSAICWLNCYHSVPLKVFVERKLIRCFSLVNTFAKNNFARSSLGNDFVLVQKIIYRFKNSTIDPHEKIKRSNYAASSLIYFFLHENTKYCDRKT